MNSLKSQISSSSNLVFVIATLLILTFFVSNGHAQNKTNEQKLFLEAYDLIKKKHYSKFNKIRKQLEGYALAPYLDYYYLKANLNKATGQRIEYFIKNEKSYLADNLRTFWLEQLGSSKQWSEFLKQYKPQKKEALQCYFVEAAYNKGSDYEKKEAKILARNIWKNSTRLTKNCAEVDTLLRKNKQLTGTLVWHRIENALNKRVYSRALYLKRDLSKAEAKMVDTWIDLIKHPKKIAKGIPSHLKGYVKQHAFEDAMYRLVRKDPDLALKTLEKYGKSSGLPEENLLAIARKAALRKAYKYEDDAEQYLEAVNKNGGSTDDSLRWHAQIAIRDSNWTELLEVISLMPQSEREDKKWQYWSARALEKTKRSTMAQKIYQTLSKQRDYYGFLAADRINADYSFNPKSVNSISEKELVQKYPALIRIQELMAIDWTKTLSLEWHFLFKNAEDNDLAGIALFAHKLEEHAIAIRGMALAKEWDVIDVRFPTPYKGVVMQNAKKHKIDAAWIYGIMRRESTYNHEIRSPVGAIGLMQIMPNTARFIGKRIGAKHYSKNALLNAKTNIELGSAYISYLSDKFNDNFVMATAAYNAGPHRVDQWTPKQKMEADQWIDTIPFTETRKYVKAVLEYRVLFTSILNQRQVRVKDWMPAVG